MPAKPWLFHSLSEVGEPSMPCRRPPVPHHPKWRGRATPSLTLLPTKKIRDAESPGETVAIERSAPHLPVIGS